MRELMLEGVCGIVEGLNPKIIRVKLDAFLEEAPDSEKESAPARGRAAQTATAKGYNSTRQVFSAAPSSMLRVVSWFSPLAQLRATCVSACAARS